MHVVRVLATGLLAGALAGIVGALLQPRRRRSASRYSPVLEARG
jgi:uncharacterized protein involved in exopolysaccharide biosynthesis